MTRKYLNGGTLYSLQRQFQFTVLPERPCRALREREPAHLGGRGTDWTYESEDPACTFQPNRFDSGLFGLEIA